jgi:cellulose synthase/poly-beta-1,6-N-acetylglucosamine synthase-like glycosyltransferase
MAPSLLGVAEALYALLSLGLWLLLLAASLHLLRLGLWALRHPLTDESVPLPDEASLPVVTVQLPMRNERLVAARAISAACALRWPRQRLQIQVLDDSDATDETVSIVDEAVAQQQQAGFDISVVRRTDRRSFKAGHLDHALPLARGEFVAVLDVDFVPSPDFLQRLVPRLVAAPQLAFVQGRWSFLNERESLLLRVQALILHGLFLVEQSYLSAHNQPVQFNGSGGVWRTEALRRAGGWVGPESDMTASVTEDLDLSYRVRLLGYSSQTLASVAIPTELPERMAAFRSQQKRWVRGGAQVLRSLVAKLLVPGRSLSERLTMLLHLTRHTRQPYLALALLFLPLGPLGMLDALFSPPGGLRSAVLLIWLALSVYYGAALRRLGQSGIAAVFLSPLVMILSMGLCVSLTSELLRGALSSRHAAEFVRTPKTGGQKQAMGQYRPVFDRLARVEVFIGLAYAVMAILLLRRGDYLTALGFAGLIAPGLLWVGGGSLRVR